MATLFGVIFGNSNKVGIVQLWLHQSWLPRSIDYMPDFEAPKARWTAWPLVATVNYLQAVVCSSVRRLSITKHKYLHSRRSKSSRLGCRREEIPSEAQRQIWALGPNHLYRMVNNQRGNRKENSMFRNGTGTHSDLWQGEGFSKYIMHLYASGVSSVQKQGYIPGGIHYNRVWIQWYSWMYRLRYQQKQIRGM